MIEETRASSRRGRLAVIIAGAAAFALGAAAITVFGPSAEPAALSERVSASQLSRLPEFRSPDEARRYFEAKARGDELTVALLDQALAEARTKGADPSYIAGLERERTLRRERRELYSERSGSREGGAAR